MNNELDKHEKVIHMNKARQARIKMVSGTTDYDNIWWRRCENDVRLTYRRFHEEY